MMKLEEFLDTEYVPIHRIGGNTQRLFRHALKNMTKYLERDPTLDDLTDKNVSGLMTWIRSKGLSARTANCHRDRLCALWRLACQQSRMTRWPTVRAEREPDRVPTAYRTEQLAAYFKSAAIEGPDYEALVRFIFETGERMTAAMSIRWSWINGDVVIIPAEHRKGSIKPGRYRLRAGCMAALEAIRREGEDDIFHRLPRSSTIYHHMKRIARRAQLPFGDGEHGFQKLRRSYASHIEANGGNATDALMHSSRTITRKHYLSPDVIGEKDWTDDLPEV